jgi:hypothetical protein
LVCAEASLETNERENEWIVMVNEANRYKKRREQS